MSASSRPLRDEIDFEVSAAGTRVSGLLLVPEKSTALLVLAHGAGAGMRHAFMEAIAQRLAARGVGTLRYQFPYMERGSNRTDPPAIAVATVRAAVAEAARRAPGVALFAGGKSFGGRMSSTAASEGELPSVRGLVFVGFPLHASGKPSIARAEHLERVTVPMLFLQGTRDTLCDLEQLGLVLPRLGARATLQIWDEADHSFHVPKRSGSSDEQVLDELADAIVAWTARQT